MPAAALTFVVAAGCGALAHHAATPTPPAEVPRPPALLPAVAAARPGLSGSSYWQPVDAPILAASSAATDLPLVATDLARAAGGDARWADAPSALREAILIRGFAVARPAHPSERLGDFYASLAEDRVARVVTADALFFLAHLAFDRALAEVDARVMTPLVSTLLHRVDARLTGETRGAGADLAPAYVVARGLVAVALALADPAYDPGAGFARLVAAERARAVAHAGVESSPWLGVSVDYAAMSPEGMADADGAGAGWFRAVAWLEGVSLALEGAGERDPHARVDVAAARVQARAVLLVSRALDAGIDPEAADAWQRVQRLGDLLVGGSDAVSPRDVAAAAASAKLDLRDPRWVADVVSVDRVRHRAAAGRTAPSFRLFAARATPDGEVLQSLTYPSVGPRIPSDAPTTWAPVESVEPIFTARVGIRALPTALDVAAWLGSGEARAALRESGDDAYDRYDDALARLARARPADALPAFAARHGTPYLSMIDAIETWLGPSAGDAVQPATVTTDWRKRKADVALSAWTELRHDATSLTRLAASLPISTNAAIATTAAAAPAAPATATAPTFVEPHPEAIAKLLAFVRQTARVLAAEGGLPGDSPAIAVLDEVDDLLWTALGAAVYESADAPLPEPLEGALAAFPARLRALEDALAGSGAADVPLAVGVHVDVPSARILEESTGRIDEAWMVMREPGTHRLWLAVGASIPHDELVQPASQRLSDGAWRARLRSGGDPPPGLLARSYVQRSEVEPVDASSP
jgi:Protein of unknown function (DUF3160)